ncbi:MAG: Uma2 family endonuclease [Planctomycetes bacterium]|nr:Uma2 family endonuclease [Planctomycetota bacterium]
MTPTATKPLVTPEQFLALEDGGAYELEDGVLVERNLGAALSWVTGRILLALAVFVDNGSRGWVFPSDTNYRCFPGHPDRMRKPDVSFVASGRFPDGRVPEGEITIAPDLVVEVTSPRDIYERVEQKAEEYLAAGVRLVWVVRPMLRSVRVCRADGSTVVLKESDRLDGGDVLPGFSVRVADLLPPGGGAAAPARGGGRKAHRNAGRGNGR